MLRPTVGPSVASHYARERIALNRTMTKPTFTQIVDIPQIKQLLEAHFQTTGVLSAILDTNENILVAVGWQDICTRFHRANPDSLARCRQSDALIKSRMQELQGDILEYRCANGLQEVAMPIVIEGEHLATFFLGQFFYDDERPDPEYFRRQAREFGFDEEDYMAALSRVPFLTRTQVGDIMDYYRILVRMMAETGLRNLRLTRGVEERKKAEEEASFFRNLVEYTRDPVYVLDPDDGWRLVYLNQAACAHYGMDREQLLTMRIPDWDPKFDMTTIDKGWQQQKQGKSVRFETVHRLASGKLVPVEVSANYLVHEGKELCVGYFHDISERKAMEARLKESERNLIEAQRIACIGNWLTDTSGNVISASTECYRIFGVTPEEFAETFEARMACVHLDDRARVRSVMEDLMKNRASGSLECRIMRPDGDERIVHIRLEPAPGEPGKPERIFGTVQDVTEQRKVMDSLMEKDLLLLQQSRLATMGEMVNYIAHQWRQPLNVIGLLVQAMRDDYLHGELGEEDLPRIVGQIMDLIRHMSGTIEDFRVFFRSGKEAKPFDLREVTCKTLSFVADSLKMSNIGLTLEAEDGLVAMGYRNEFSHVLLNLLNNAREALAEKGTASPGITIRIFREEDTGVISIRDNAGGIPPDIIGKLFDCYFTTKEKGTGVGLYMCRTIIEKRMGGSIAAHNVDDGAEFRVRIPLVNPNPYNRDAVAGRID